MANRIKLVGISIVALLTVITVLQNTEVVETRFLFFSLSMPRAALLFGALVVGFSVGVLVSNRMTARAAAASVGVSDKEPA